MDAIALLMLFLESITLHKLFEKEPFCFYADIQETFALQNTKHVYLPNRGRYHRFARKEKSQLLKGNSNQFCSIGLYVVLNKCLKCCQMKRSSVHQYKRI